MMRRQKTLLTLVILLISVSPGFSNRAKQSGADTSDYRNFIKSELNSGLRFYRNNGRESLITDFSEFFEKRFNYNVYYDLTFNSWNFLSDRQESLKLSGGIGPVYSGGESSRSNSLTITSFENKIFGLSLYGEVAYSGRYYYDNRNYALIEVRGFGRFEKLKIHSEGSAVPANGSYVAPIHAEEKYIDNRLRYGINARAGAGFGRLEVKNHLMQTEYLLEKYYEGKLFSMDEKERLATQIAKIKNNRKPATHHSSEKEKEDLKQFVRGKMLLQFPETIDEFSELGEFPPRYEGTRFEIGPLFNYYNREPDFVYGGFISYENHKYKSYNQNLSIASDLSYNRYKNRDWFLWSNSVQLSYYCKLRSKISFGIEIAPAMVVNDFQDIEPIQFVVIPFVDYYHQINNRHRVSFAFRYKITDENDFYIKGPEFSLSWYRSRY